MSATCVKCGAKCCRYFCLEIDSPDSFEEFEHIRWYLMHEGVTVHIDGGDWFLGIDNRCKMLDKDNRCTDYDNRPSICREYPDDDCDHSDGEYGYDALFTTPDELVAYARKTLGKKAYDRARAKAYGAGKQKKSAHVPKK